MSAEESAIRVDWAGDEIAIVELVGEHDMSTCTSIEQELERAGQQAKGVVVDLRVTSFIDSSVIHVLIAAARSAGERGNGFSLCLGTAGVVNKALELTGVAARISSADEISGAIRLASGRA